MTAHTQRMETLRKRREAIDAKINAAQARLKETDRKEENRLKVLVGAALLTDVLHHPETRAGIASAINRAITSEKDRLFLQTKGWL